MSDFPERKWLSHATPSWVSSSNERFFLTICCAERGREQLTLQGISDSILESVRYGHQRGDWWMHLCVLMPDHMHCVVSFPEMKGGMTAAISNWKRLMARRLGIKWQKGFFDHRLRTDEAFDEKAAYVRLNPVRAGLCERPIDWPHIWSVGGSVFGSVDIAED
ncbi:MAG: REP-associated tyrosine transposase [Opitutaceae bacterium]